MGQEQPVRRPGVAAQDPGDEAVAADDHCAHVQAQHQGAWRSSDTAPAAAVGTAWQTLGIAGDGGGGLRLRPIYVPPSLFTTDRGWLGASNGPRLPGKTTRQ